LVDQCGNSPCDTAASLSVCSIRLKRATTPIVLSRGLDHANFAGKQSLPRGDDRYPRLDP
jgi:hypothetical protein